MQVPVTGRLNEDSVFKGAKHALGSSYRFQLRIHLTEEKQELSDVHWPPFYTGNTMDFLEV